MIRDEIVPDEGRIYAWIEEVFGHGIRRPGYPADRWAEGWLQEQFRAFGLESVRAEPVEMPYWEPGAASLMVTGTGGVNERDRVLRAAVHARRRRRRPSSLPSTMSR